MRASKNAKKCVKIMFMEKQAKKSLKKSSKTKGILIGVGVALLVLIAMIVGYLVFGNIIAETMGTQSIFAITDEEKDEAIANVVHHNFLADDTSTTANINYYILGPGLMKGVYKCIETKTDFTATGLKKPKTVWRGYVISRKQLEKIISNNEAKTSLYWHGKKVSKKKFLNKLYPEDI